MSQPINLTTSELKLVEAYRAMPEVFRRTTHDLAVSISATKKAKRSKNRELPLIPVMCVSGRRT